MSRKILLLLAITACTAKKESDPADTVQPSPPPVQQPHIVTGKAAPDTLWGDQHRWCVVEDSTLWKNAIIGVRFEACDWKIGAPPS